MTQSGGEFLTSGEVAKLLGASVGSVAEWANQGLLPCHRLPGGHRRFRREDVQRFLDEQKGSVA